MVRGFMSPLSIWEAFVNSSTHDSRSEEEDVQKRTVGRDTCRRSNSKPGLARKVLPLENCCSNLAAFEGGTTTEQPPRHSNERGLS